VHEDDRPGRRVDFLAVDREERVSGHHGEEFLVAVRLVLLVGGLVMLLDHLVTGVSGRSVDAERLHVEMATDVAWALAKNPEQRYASAGDLPSAAAAAARQAGPRRGATAAADALVIRRRRTLRARSASAPA
jgi:hypothetical protein